ncbi:MAG: response regulator [Oscillospiraceae bacterium]|nr:response regulator [Oscillospiraceae bacterium]
MKDFKKPMRIFVFDDNPATRKYIKSYWENKGHAVTSCHSCEKAVKIINNNVFDLYIIDLSASPKGLENEDFISENGFFLTGWFLFKDHILVNDEEAICKTVFYSEHISELKSFIKKSPYAYEYRKKLHKYFQLLGAFVYKSETLESLEDFIEDKNVIIDKLRELADDKMIGELKGLEDEIKQMRKDRFILN